MAALTVILLLASSCLMNHACAEGPLEVAEMAANESASFSKDVLPALKQNCLACHNAMNDEAGVNLESVQAIAKSDIDQLLVPGKPEMSRLFLLASHQGDPIMPPEDNDVAAKNFSPLQLASLRRWIQRGAKPDSVSVPTAKLHLQPLSPTNRINYSASLTSDGRLVAGSFGNQVYIFAYDRELPIARLGLIADDGKPLPPHRDVVQSLAFSADASQLVSTGFRNIKLWRKSGPESVETPDIDVTAVAAFTTNSDGKRFALLSQEQMSKDEMPQDKMSPKGKLSVAQIGSRSWDWEAEFEIPEKIAKGSDASFLIAIDDVGQTVAIASEKQIWIGRKDSEVIRLAENEQKVSCLIWAGSTLVIGTHDGFVSFWNHEDEEWVSTTQKVSQASIHAVHRDKAAQTERLIVVDAKGSVFIGEGLTDAPKKVGKLPAAPMRLSINPLGTKKFASLSNRAFGCFDLSGHNFIEFAKQDPMLNEEFSRYQWEKSAGQKIVAAQQLDLTTAQANEKAEQANIGNLTKDIATKKKSHQEKQQAAAAADKATADAKSQWERLKQTQSEANEERSRINDEVKSIDAQLSADGETDIDELKQTKTQLQKKLTALATEQALTESVEQAKKKFDDAQSDAETKAKDLAAATRRLKQAEASKTRSQKQLAKLKANVAAEKELAQQATDEQAERTKLETDARPRAANSSPADRGISAWGSDFVLTKSSDSNLIHRWTSSGQWIDSMEPFFDGDCLAVSGRSIYFAGEDGSLECMQLDDRLWKHDRTIGSMNGSSPFADRVLCSDIDPFGHHFAVGGGKSARSGQIHLFRSDGTLMHAIEDAHSDTVLAVAYSPDGKTLASGSSDRLIKLWDVETGQLVKTLEGHTHHVTTLAWNINGRQLASGSADATVRAWDVEKGFSTRTITGMTHEITGITFVGRDDFMAVISGDQHFRVLRAVNGAKSVDAVVGLQYLYALASNRDGTRFVVGGADGQLKSIDKSGKKLTVYAIETP